MLPAPNRSLPDAACHSQLQAAYHYAGSHFASLPGVAGGPGTDCACPCCCAGPVMCQQEQCSTECCHSECCSGPCPRTILFSVPRCSGLILLSFLHFSLLVTHCQTYLVQSLMQYGTVNDQAVSSRSAGACHIKLLLTFVYGCLMKGKPITHVTADHAFDISCYVSSTCPTKHQSASLIMHGVCSELPHQK